MIRSLRVAFGLLSILSANIGLADHGPSTWQVSAPSVVTVLPTWPGHQRPGFGAPPGQAPAGSGFFWSPDGKPTAWVMTAAHVIADATRVEVVTADGSQVDAEVFEVDPETDLALLRLPLQRPGFTLKVERIVPGTHVCALGHPFGLPLSMSCGVISGELRSNLGFNAVESFVQTDAAVNPGVSGGALVSAQGQLVGMVSAIYTKDADIDAGVNFAVSSGLIARWISQFDLRLSP